MLGCRSWRRWRQCRGRLICLAPAESPTRACHVVFASRDEQANRAGPKFQPGPLHTPNLGRRWVQAGRFLVKRLWVSSSRSVARIKIFRLKKLLGWLVESPPLQVPCESLQAAVALRSAAVLFPAAQICPPLSSSCGFFAVIAASTSGGVG